MDNSSLLTNFTGVITEVYTGWQIVFALITLPAAILSLLSIVALFMAEKIDWNLKIILINIFTAEFIASIGSTLVFIGYPLRMLFEVSDIRQHPFPCSFLVGIMIAGETANVSSYAFYSIMVFVFLKKNINKVKVYVMTIPCLFIWLPSLFWGSTIFSYIFTRSFPINAVLVNKGFCTFVLTTQSNSRTIAFLSQLIFLWLHQVVLCGGTIVTFFILTAHYIKKNVSNDNEVKLAIAKNLLFLSVGALMSIFLAVVIPTVVVATLTPDVSRFIATQYVLDLLRSFLSLYISVITIAYLKPIKKALSHLLKKYLNLEQGQTTDN